jgi:hypothetical protein
MAQQTTTRKKRAISRGGLELESVERPEMVPHREGMALFPWMARPDVRPTFHGSAVTSPATVDEFVAAWESRQTSKPTGPAVTAIAARLLPATLDDQVTALEETEQFRTHYQPFGASFAVIGLEELITPQWWADSKYVDELAVNAPAAGDAHRLFDFCFSMGELAPPVLLGTNGAAFASPRRNLGSITPLRLVSSSSGKATFQFDVVPRPNWVWIGAVQGMSRLYITNGVHHLLALKKLGRTEAFCLIRTVGSFDQLGMNFQDPGMFKVAEVTSARPPLLRDYLDDQVASAVSVRALDQFMRIAVNADAGVVPRGE